VPIVYIALAAAAFFMVKKPGGGAPQTTSAGATPASAPVVVYQTPASTGRTTSSGAQSGDALALGILATVNQVVSTAGGIIRTAQASGSSKK